LERELRALAAASGVAPGKVFQPIRIALTGGTVSEPVNELLYVIGKEGALRRLEAVIRGP
jgi:glutamyl-tRNA synthetase